MKPMLDNPYGYKVCYPVGKNKRYKHRFITRTFKQAMDIKEMYYRYPPDDNGKPIKDVTWLIFPITKKEVIRGIWREVPF